MLILTYLLNIYYSQGEGSGFNSPTLSYNIGNNERYVIG